MAQRSEMIVGDAGIKANPYPLYARMRAEAPVCSVLYAASRSRVWMVTRYEDVVTVLKVWRLSNDPRKREAPGTVRSKVLSLIFARLVNNMLNSDQPDHPRLRALVHQAFTPKRIEELRQRIQALTYELLERASSKGNWDVVSDYAVPIPATIIAEMLGVPLKDRERFGKWSTRSCCRRRRGGKELRAMHPASWHSCDMSERWSRLGGTSHKTI